MAPLPLKLITDGQRIQGGMITFQEHGQPKIKQLGPSGPSTFTPTLTEVESRSSESGRSLLIGSYITGTDGVLAIPDIECRSETLERALFLASTTYRTQSAVTSATMNVEDVEIDDALEIPGIDPTIISVTDGASSNPVDYDEDVLGVGEGHYTYQKHRSLIQFVGIPEGAGPDAKITYSLPEITEADEIVEREIMKTSGVRGKLCILGVIAEGMPGKADDYIFPDVELRGDGAITMMGTDGVNRGSLTANVYDNGNGYGYIRPVRN